MRHFSDRIALANRHFLPAILLCAACLCQAAAQMKVESLTGPVTKAETDSFLVYVSTLNPDRAPDRRYNHCKTSGSSSVAERQLPKLNVAGSIPVSRSTSSAVASSLTSLLGFRASQDEFQTLSKTTVIAIE